MQKELWAAAIAGTTLLSGVAVERPVNSPKRYALEERDTIRRTLPLTANAPPHLELSNLSGGATAGDDRN